VDTQRPSPRTNLTRRVPHPVLIGHAASLTPYQNIRCNNLLPVLGPATPAHVYAQHAERYWGGVAQLGRHEGSRFRMVSGPASMSNFTPKLYAIPPAASHHCAQKPQRFTK
jgi:hypothetical protein